MGSVVAARTGGHDHRALRAEAREALDVLDGGLGDRAGEGTRRGHDWLVVTALGPELVED
jgi:hypothetical protein